MGKSLAFIFQLQPIGMVHFHCKFNEEFSDLKHFKNVSLLPLMLLKLDILAFSENL